MTIENTVSIDFLFAFINCEERFRLPPTRCGTVDSKIDENPCKKYELIQGMGCLYRYIS